MGRPAGPGFTETRSGVVVSNGELQRRKRARRIARTEDQIIAARLRAHPDGLKVCHGCKRPLPFHAFAALTREVDGLNPHCFGCRDARKNKEPHV